jgi:hypothetical protein
MSLTIAALGLFLVVVLFSVCFNWWSADRLEGQAPVQAGVGGGGGGSSAVGPQNGRLGWSMPAVGTIANPQNGTAMNGGGSYGGAAMYKNVAEPTLPKWVRFLNDFFFNFIFK